MNRYVAKVLASITAVVMAFVLAFGGAVHHEDPAQAAGQCVVQVQGTVGVVICADVPIAQVPLPTVTVKGPTVTLPAATVTVNVPGPTKTVTIPGGTQTVTTTVTEEVSNGNPTETVTVSPEPSSLPTATVTETGQSPPGDGTIGDDGPTVDFGDGTTTIVEVGLGLLATIALVGLLLLALWSGYYIGYKDKEKKDTSFMRALLEQVTLRRAHK